MLDACFLSRLDEVLEHTRVDRWAAEDRRPAPEAVVAGLVGVAGGNVRGVRDVDRDRDLRPQPIRRGPSAVVAELLLRTGDDGQVRTVEAAQQLERDVDPRAVVEVPRGNAAAGELERRRHSNDRVAGRDQRAHLLPSLAPMST